MIYDNIAKYCADQGLSIMAFEKKCHLGNAVVREWKGGKSKPNIASLEKIAAATGIPISEWLGEGAKAQPQVEPDKGSGQES